MARRKESKEKKRSERGSETSYVKLSCNCCIQKARHTKPDQERPSRHDHERT
jgi:hypothetical protein